MRRNIWAAAAMLVTITSASAATDEGQKFISAFKHCTEDYATKLAPSGETVDSIVIAAFAFCASIENDMRRFLLATIRNVDTVERVLNQHRQIAREHLTEVILNARQSQPAQKLPIEQLIAIWLDLNSMCRGWSGDSRHTDEVCVVREKVDRVLGALGYCYGQRGQSDAQMQWHKCTSQSLRPPP